MRNLDPANLPARQAWNPGRRLAVSAQGNPSLRRALILAPAWHLDQASTFLRQHPNVDAMMLAATKTAGLVAVMGIEVRQLDVPLPANVIDTMPELHHWAATLKEQVRGRQS
jgi:hypothetical protein